MTLCSAEAVFKDTGRLMLTADAFKELGAAEWLGVC